MALIFRRPRGRWPCSIIRRAMRGGACCSWVANRHASQWAASPDQPCSLPRGRRSRAWPVTTIHIMEGCHWSAVCAFDNGLLGPVGLSKPALLIQGSRVSAVWMSLEHLMDGFPGVIASPKYPIQHRLDFAVTVSFPMAHSSTLIEHETSLQRHRPMQKLPTLYLDMASKAFVALMSTSN